MYSLLKITEWFDRMWHAWQRLEHETGFLSSLGINHTFSSSLFQNVYFNFWLSVYLGFSFSFNYLTCQWLKKLGFWSPTFILIQKTKRKQHNAFFSKGVKNQGWLNTFASKIPRNFLLKEIMLTCIQCVFFLVSLYSPLPFIGIYWSDRNVTCFCVCVC